MIQKVMLGAIVYHVHHKLGYFISSLLAMKDKIAGREFGAAAVMKKLHEHHF